MYFQQRDIEEHGIGGIGIAPRRGEFGLDFVNKQHCIKKQCFVQALI
jgi:hypothetical protein